MDRTEGSLYTVVKLNKGIIRYYYTGIEVPSGNECAMNYTISSSGHSHMTARSLIFIDSSVNLCSWGKIGLVGFVNLWRCAGILNLNIQPGFPHSAAVHRWMLY